METTEAAAAIRFFNALFDFCYEVSHCTDEELRQELINDGIDVDALTDRIEAIVAKGLVEHDRDKRIVELAMNGGENHAGLDLLDLDLLRKLESKNSIFVRKGITAAVRRREMLKACAKDFRDSVARRLLIGTSRAGSDGKRSTIVTGHAPL